MRLGSVPTQISSGPLVPITTAVIRSGPIPLGSDSVEGRAAIRTPEHASGGCADEQPVAVGVADGQTVEVGVVEPHGDGWAFTPLEMIRRAFRIAR